MFSQKVEYALRAVVHLAYKAPAAQTTEQIAAATRVPQAYLAKVLQGLTHAGVVRSQRGVGGGISLVKTPARLTLLEVVNAVDPIRRIATCPLGLASHGVRLCPLHKRSIARWHRSRMLSGTPPSAEISGGAERERTALRLPWFDEPRLTRAIQRLSIKRRR